MQVMLMRLMSKGEYLIVPKGTKFTGAGKLRLKFVFHHRIMLSAPIFALIRFGLNFCFGRTSGIK